MSTQRRNDLLRIVVLALISTGGIIGMLLVEGVADAAFFCLSLLPLVLGGWRAYVVRHKGVRRPR